MTQNQTKVPTFEKIGVIVGLDLVGDALLKLPFVRLLRASFPSAEIHWITSQGPTAYGKSLRSLTQSLINAVDECPCWLKTKANPRPSGPTPAFDLIIDTRGRWRETLNAKQSLAPRVFIAPAMRFLFSSRRPPLFAPRPHHMADRLVRQLSLVVPLLPEVSQSLSLPQPLMEKAQQILPPSDPYIGLAPGAGGKIKAWPLENYIALAQHQTTQGHIPVFLLGPDEVAWQGLLAQAVPNALFPLQAKEIWSSPTLTLEQTMAVGRLLKLAVVNDSGTSHILSAVDCPLISLFGPTSPSKFQPRVSLSRTLCVQQFGGEVMSDLPLAPVEAAVDALLSAIDRS